jgi:hypothetical protein
MISAEVASWIILGALGFYVILSLYFISDTVEQTFKRRGK